MRKEKEWVSKEGVRQTERVCLSVFWRSLQRSMMWFLQMAQLSTTMSHDQSVTAFHFLISSRFFFAPPSSLFKAAALASSIFTSAMATAPYPSYPSRASLHLTTGCGARSPRPRPLQARAPSGRPEPSFFWRARPSPQNQDDPEQNRGGWQHHGRRTVRERRRWIGVKEVGPRGGGQPEHCEREGRKARRRRSQGP